jgi:uncharacterized protein YhbP (UPF0306 family)
MNADGARPTAINLLLASAARVFSQWQICCLSAVLADEAQSWMLYFANSGTAELYFATGHDSGLSVALGDRRHVSIAVFDPSQAWGEPHSGIRAHGIARRLPPSDAAQAQECYVRRFPQAQSAVRAEEFQLYVVDVDTLHIVDEAAFGRNQSYVLEKSVLIPPAL